MRKILLTTFVLLLSCQERSTPPSAPSSPSFTSSPSAVPSAAPSAASSVPLAVASKSAAGSASVVVSNDTGATAEVHVAFGAGSVIQPSNWSSFCTPPPSDGAVAQTCHFALRGSESRRLPLEGKWLNATLAFNATPSCGSTKAELNVNNPSWYDIVDVSLVDGYNNKIKITALEPAADASSVVLGPPAGPTGNERVFGVFPFGCDICVARQSPPCGIKPGKEGCKTGSQYNPDVPCQYQGTVKGGGTAVTVALVP